MIGVLPNTAHKLLRSSAAADGGRCHEHTRHGPDRDEVAILGRRGRRPLLSAATQLAVCRAVAILGRRGRRPLQVTTAA